MVVGGVAWFTACVALAGMWTVAVAWRTHVCTWPALVRGVLGGIAALGVATIGYGLCQLGGMDLDWQKVTRGAPPALGFAATIGVVEEGAKLTGILLAVTSRGWRNIVQTTAAVASVFAMAEAVQILQGLSWVVALSRAALGPVAHGILALPMAIALSHQAARSRLRLALHVLVAFGFAAVLHGLGDWSVARPGWGRVGYAAVLVVPCLWLYARRRGAAVTGLGRSVPTS